MNTQRIEAPPELNRNNRRVQEVGYEESGERLLRHMAEVAGLTDLATTDVLDVGCGVRFTQTIVNRAIPVRSYTGVDVEPKVIDWLQANVCDPRFRFALWEVRNDMYNKRGKPFTRDSRLPVDGTFDFICMFSVVTHLAPADADAMLHVLRPHARDGGKLFFSAFVDDAVATFLDRDPVHPLRKATYNERHLTEIVTRNGWRVTKSIPRRRDLLVAHQFLCVPA